MRITPEIASAIEKAIERYGNVSHFAKSLGIAHSTVLFWLSGKTASVSGDIWMRKLKPALEPFMEGAGREWTSPAEERVAKALEQMREALKAIVAAEVELALRERLSKDFEQLRTVQA